MRLFAKIFICSMMMLSIAVLFSGYLLLTYSYEGAMKREREWALNQYQYNKFSVQASLIENWGRLQGEDESSEELVDLMDSGQFGETAFFSRNRELLESSLPEGVEAALPEGMADDVVVYGYQKAGEKVYLTIGGKLVQDNITLYLLTAVDITPTLMHRQYMTDGFRKVYFITMAVGSVLVLFLSSLLTRPIKKLTKAAARITKGQYHERIVYGGGDEIAELSASFNGMTQAIEEKVSELSENARQKEDFVAGFAHELKTPLTSVIGYADMLYQKELPSEEVKSAAWYILNEGLRLEALSLKLMDLIMLDKQEFVLEEMEADELLKNILDSMKQILEDKKVICHLEAEPGTVKVEYDLFKTLLLNLVDNSVKAGCNDVWISGRHRKEDAYQIRVADNGRGIPAHQLDRITEAFYMVDKSRSRRQHGVGLGLSLAERIAQIHGSSLIFHSKEAEFTVVEFDISCKGGRKYA